MTDKCFKCGQDLAPASFGNFDAEDNICVVCDPDIGWARAQKPLKAATTDIVERLRDQGKDVFAKHYSLGMFKLCAEAADEIERLRAAVSRSGDADV